MRDRASIAGRRLLADRDTYLVLLKWPSHDVLGTYDLAAESADLWDDITSGPYIAIRLID
jgi:hypothetical protein